MKITILSKIWEKSVETLQATHECTIAINPPLEEKKEAIKDAEVVVIRSPVKLDKETLDAAPNLKLIVRAGMGLDSIDVNYAKEKGIKIIIVPLSAEGVAEQVLALIFAVYRQIPFFHESLKEGRWEKHSTLSREIFGKKVGLIGFGRIGRRVAELLKAFNVELYAYDRSPDTKKEFAEELGVKLVSLEEVCKVSDIISIQAPLNDASRNLINQDALSKMKKEAIIVNVGRGGIIDETALYKALKEGNLGAAAFDVFATEPPKDSKLLKLKNFVGTPHVGAQTMESQGTIGNDVLKIIDAYTKGEEITTGMIV
tara:strand:- start:3811 stop:4749 length:939 start_codon:yes stop_codon:yes gene_type:complete